MRRGSSGVIYARILIWIVSNAAAIATGGSKGVCDQISVEHRKRCHFGAGRRGVFDTLVQTHTHSLALGLSSGSSLFFVCVDTVLNVSLSLKFGQVSPPSIHLQPQTRNADSSIVQLAEF